MDRAQRRKQMIELLARREHEGLSYRALEEQTGISRNTLAAWAARLRSERGTNRALPALPFVELVATDGGPTGECPIEITVGAHVVRVRRGFDAETLSRVVAALASSC